MYACDEYLEKISRWLDTDLTPDEQEELFEHLAHCPNCAHTLSMFEELRISANENQKNPPSVLHDGVMNTVRAEKKRFRFSRFRFTAVAAVFALIVLGISYSPLQNLLAPVPNEPRTVNEPAVVEHAPQAARILPSAPVQEDAPVADDTTEALHEDSPLAESEGVELVDADPVPEATPTEDELEIDAVSLPETPFDRAFSAYLAFSATDAPEVLYQFVSELTEDHTVYYIIPSEKMAEIQSALLSMGLDFVFTPADPAQTEALVMLTVTHE